MIDDRVGSWPGAATAAAFAEAVESGRLNLPLPGGGRTRERWAVLADLAGEDLSLARLAEGHADALAILAELGILASPPAGNRWGVWAAQPPGPRLMANRTGGGWRLDGTKQYCSGARSLTHVVSDRDRVAPNRIDLPGTAEEAWDGWVELKCLPVADPLAWPSTVIVAAHPDDEILGAGGTLARLAAGGTRLRLVAVTDGEASHPGTDPRATTRRRTAESADALRLLGVRDIEVVRLCLPDTGLAACEDELSGRLGELCDGFGVCLTPWEQDAHADHEAAGRAARQAGRQVLSYPIWMWHWAKPGDRRVPWQRACQVLLSADVTARKAAAINAFASQLTDRAGTGPVLPPGIVAHFTRDQEVLLR